jgi:hypothetical protein
MNKKVKKYADGGKLDVDALDAKLRKEGRDVGPITGALTDDFLDRAERLAKDRRGEAVDPKRFRDQAMMIPELGAVGISHGLGTVYNKARDKVNEKIDTTTRNLKDFKQRITSKKSGGMVKSSASKRADGIATKGKTRGRMI